MLSFFFGIVVGLVAYLFARVVLGGLFTVQQNERAVVTTFGRAPRVGDSTTLDHPVSEHLNEEQKSRYAYPQIQVRPPGGPYYKFPWQRVHKVNVSIQTVNAAFDPDAPTANFNNTILEAVTKDQLNIGITGQLRYRVSEDNFYAYLFGVHNPIAHVMGYFVSILRERISNFEELRKRTSAQVSAESDTIVSAPGMALPMPVPEPSDANELEIEGISLNDLRKNLNELNRQMDEQSRSSAARYGVVLDASLITGIDPPQEIESALAAINTAHNEVSADLSTARALADQTIEQSKRAVEIETMRAEAEVQPLLRVAEQISELKRAGSGALNAYVSKVRLDLMDKASRIIAEVKS